MSATHRNISTVHPSFTALGVFADEDTLASLGGRLPPAGTLYKDFPKGIVSKDYLKLYANYVYVNQEVAKGGVELIFAPGMTDAEINVPFRVEPETKKQFWDTVLKGAQFIPITTYPATGATVYNDGVNNLTAKTYVTRYKVKWAYIQGNHFNTKFTTEEFFSPRPFKIPFQESPVTAPVHIELPTGEQYSFPTCLHKKLKLESLLAGFALSNAAGDVSAQAEIIEGQLFPETNFTEWDTYYLEDTQKFTGNGYHRVRIRVDPPDEPNVTLSVD